MKIPMAGRMSALVVAAVLVLPNAVMGGTISGTGDPASHPSLAGGVAIDFESFANGSFHTSLVFPGVQMTGTGGDLQVLDNFGGSFNVTGNSVALRTSTPVQAVTFDFSSNVKAFGLNVGGTDKTWQLTAFSDSHAVLGQVDLPILANDNSGYWIGLAFNGIASASLVNTQYRDAPGSATQDYIVFDNFNYASSVPEPRGILLIGLGLLGFALMRRKYLSWDFRG